MASAGGFSTTFQGGVLLKRNDPVLAFDDPNATVDARFGVTLFAGMLGEYRLSKWHDWSGEVGAIYSFQPISYTVSDGVASASDTMTSQAVRLPFTIRWNRWRFLQFGGGAYYDYNLSGLANDMGVSASLRIQVPFGKSSALVNEVRYNQGLTSFDGVSNQEIMISVGFRAGALQ